ncbi:hypothetical protein M3Y98_00090000 [Aphelenchoides besseyi]|nr:hypothetical protein M3Y98_00090000 [Aphelenchoides besseyi]
MAPKKSGQKTGGSSAEKKPKKPSKGGHVNFCRYCDCTVDEDVTRHTQTVHWKFLSLGAGVFCCSLCSYRSRNLTARDQHFRTKHAGNPMVSVDWPKEIRAQFYCWLCRETRRSPRTLYEHCIEAHPNSDDWSNSLKEYQTKTKRLFALTKNQLKKNKLKNLAQKKHVTCISAVSAGRTIEHDQTVHLARRSFKGLLYLCPECPYRSYNPKIRNQHIQDNHRQINLNEPLVYKEADNVYHCDSCVSVHSTRKDLLIHFSSAHRQNGVVESEQSNVQETTSESDEEDETIPVRKVKTEPEETLKVEKKKRKIENQFEEPIRFKKPKLELIGPEEELSVASISPQMSNESEVVNYIETLLSAMLQRPSLNLKFGTLPIDLWMTTDECKVLFLRLDSNQWNQKPQLENPLVSASMLRLDAPRNANRNAFLLGFVKSTAEEMAATLLVETNPHMSFVELVVELIPSLNPKSTLIIANGVDKQTAYEHLSNRESFVVV